jgi:MFS family permease
VITQVLAMVQSFAMGGLALSGAINIWWILGLALFQGLINAFDMPARQSFLVDMIEHREDLGNAIALNSSMVNGSRLIGPAIAGVVIAGVGEAYCFLIDGVSYLAVIGSLLAMRVVRRPRTAEHQSVLAELREGWRHVAGSAGIRSILLLLALVSLIAMPYTILMPIIAASVLRGGPNTLGFLMGASGVGAMISAVSLALRRTVLGLGKRIVYAAGLFGAGLIVLGLSRHVGLSVVAMVLAGFGMMQQTAASNTILQTIVPDEMRGRVMSFYTLAIFGVTPIGSLLAGFSANRIGAPATLASGGALCVIGAALFAWQLPAVRRDIRPIYLRLGILPESEAPAPSATLLPPEG